MLSSNRKCQDVNFAEIEKNGSATPVLNTRETGTPGASVIHQHSSTAEGDHSG